MGPASDSPAHAWRRRTRRGAASSVAQIALLFGLPASLPRLVRRSLARAREFRQSLLAASPRLIQSDCRPVVGENPNCDQEGSMAVEKEANALSRMAKDPVSR